MKENTLDLKGAIITLVDENGNEMPNGTVVEKSYESQNLYREMQANVPCIQIEDNSSCFTVVRNKWRE